MSLLKIIKGEKLMKIIKKFFIISIFIFISLIILSIKSNASSDLLLNNLDFNAFINSDGSMDITETWDIKIKDTNTLFKTFKLDSGKYKDITNIQVTDITNGENKEFRQINTLMYHVTKNCYYGLINDDGNFEIAWGVGLDNSSDTKKYKISYTVQDAISKHNDYAQLYWQFIGSDFEINAKKVTGSIILPGQVENKDEIRVWGHTEDLNGEIYVTDLNKINFELDGFNSRRFVEIRVLFPTGMIVSSGRTSNNNILEDVINEETSWANEANERRTRRNMSNLLITAITVTICIILAIYSLKQALKASNKLKDFKEYKPTQKLKYFRELPRKDATPAQALHVYKETKVGFADAEIGKIVSATLLNLNLKKYIDFKIENEKNKEKIIMKITNSDIINLSADEKVIFEFLKKACKEKDEITVKDFQKYIKSTSTTNILALKKDLNLQTKKELIEKQLFDTEKEKIYKKYQSKNTLYCTVIFFVIFGAAFLTEFLTIIGYTALFGLIVCEIISIIINNKAMKKINVYTQKGIDEKEMWKGLKKYMEDFSMLDKREVPEIAIWEHFLVFATAFGIANKVLKQLKIIYPDLENNLDINTYTYMYLMMNTNFSSSFSNAISTSMSSAYSSASGGGGGFSGGGRTEAGGRRWGRR